MFAGSIDWVIWDVLPWLAFLLSGIAAGVMITQTLTLRRRYKKQFENYVARLEAQLEDANRVIEEKHLESQAAISATQLLEQRLRDLKSQVDGLEARRFAIEPDIVSASHGTASASSLLSEVFWDEGIRFNGPPPPGVIRASEWPPGD
jgi:hypothetical protein